MIFLFPKLVYAWLRQIPQTGCGIIYPVMYKIVMMMVLWYDTTIHWYPLLPRLLIPRTIPFFPLSPPPPPLWPRASIIAARMSGADNYLVSRECDGARDGVWLCLLFCHRWHSPQWAALLTQSEHTNALLILRPGDTNNPSKDKVTTKERFSKGWRENTSTLARCGGFEKVLFTVLGNKIGAPDLVVLHWILELSESQ